jgi:hypothetical protein
MRFLIAAGLLASISLTACSIPLAPGGTSVTRADAPGFATSVLKSEVDTVSNVQVVDARPSGDLPVPPYPEALKATDRRHVRIPIRIVVNRAGRVQSVTLNAGAFTSMIPQFDAYWQSIQQTVVTWQFNPARKIYLVPTPGREKMTIEEELVDMYLDYVITFDPRATTSAAKARGDARR